MSGSRTRRASSVRWIAWGLEFAWYVKTWPCRASGCCPLCLGFLLFLRPFAAGSAPKGCCSDFARHGLCCCNGRNWTTWQEVSYLQRQHGPKLARFAGLLLWEVSCFHAVVPLVLKRKKVFMLYMLHIRQLKGQQPAASSCLAALLFKICKWQGFDG